MLQPMQLTDEKATRYATVADFCEIFAEDMHSLYLLAFMLTADHDQAQQCFACGLDECYEGMGVFVDGARAWARRTIAKLAIRMIGPVPERIDNFAFRGFKRAAASRKNNYLASVLALNPFDRFVFVMSVLERQSDEDCTHLLRCSRQELLSSRKRAYLRLAEMDEPCITFDDYTQGWLTNLHAAE